MTTIHPSEYLSDELHARGWSRDDLATRMAIDGGLVEWKVNRFAIDMYIEVGPTNSGLRLGDMARRFGQAFGTSTELWANLETAWLSSRTTESGEQP